MRPVLVVGILLLLWPIAARAELLLICEQGSGDLSVTTFTRDDPVYRSAVRARLETAGVIPGGSACWEADRAILPSRTRPDPRGGPALTQRTRWRRAGQAVIVDPAIKRPQADAIQREYGRLLPPVRWAEIVATPLGSALDRAVREGRWADVRAALTQTGTGQPLTGAEITQFRAILRDYEAD